MKQEILRMIRDDLGYYHPIGYQEYTEPLLILETIFHDLPEPLLTTFFKEAAIGWVYAGNDMGFVKKKEENRALISIYNVEDDEGPNYEYEIDIVRLVELAQAYERIENQRPDEIYFKKIGDEISIEGHFKNKRSEQ